MFSDQMRIGVYSKKKCRDAFKHEKRPFLLNHRGCEYYNRRAAFPENADLSWKYMRV